TPEGTTQYGYLGNLMSIVHKDSSNNLLASHSYGYTPASRLSSETDNGATTTYTYDARSELTQAGSTSYTFDLNGNPTGTGHTITSPNLLASDGTWNYTYDAVGDTITQTGVSGGSEAGVSWTYGYNDANQMTSAVETVNGTTAQEVSFTYDVFGNRIGE